MLGKKRLKSKDKEQSKGQSQSKGKRKVSIKEPIKKGVIKKINDNKYHIEGSQVSYVVRGKGRIKVNKGYFNLNGYCLNQGEDIEFDYTNESNPLFISTLDNNDSDNVIEIELSKGNKDTQIIDMNNINSNKAKGNNKANYVSIPNELKDIVEYKTILLTGKINSDKSLYIPIMINKLLALKEKRSVCLIDFDNSPNSKFAINLLLLTKPILTNDSCYCSQSNACNIVSSIYQNDMSDINQCIQVVQYLISKAQNELKSDCLIINTPTQSAEMYSPLLYKLIQSNTELGNKAVVYIQNQNSNDQESALEDIILKHKQDPLTQLMFGGYNNENNIDTIIIEINNKRNENESSESMQTNANNSILSLYDHTKCNKITIPLCNILFCLNDDCYSYQDILSSIDILQMFTNRHCVILFPNKDPSHSTKDSLNYLFLSNIPIEQRNYISIAKVISIDMNTNSISLYTDNSIVRKDKRIVLIADNRIDKSMKEAKSVRYQKLLFNIIFPYSIINTENNIKMKASYLGRNSYNLI